MVPLYQQMNKNNDVLITEHDDIVPNYEKI